MLKRRYTVSEIVIGVVVFLGLIGGAVELFQFVTKKKDPPQPIRSVYYLARHKNWKVDAVDKHDRKMGEMYAKGMRLSLTVDQCQDSFAKPMNTSLEMDWLPARCEPVP